MAYVAAWGLLCIIYTNILAVLISTPWTSVIPIEFVYAIGNGDGYDVDDGCVVTCIPPIDDK